MMNNTNQPKPNDHETWLAHAFADYLCDWENKYRTNKHLPLLPQDKNETETRFLIEIAKKLSLANSRGATCILCDDVVDKLKKYCVIKHHKEDIARPLIIDDANLLYFDRYFQYEKNIAQKLMLLKKDGSSDTQAIINTIKKVCDDKSNLNAEQKLAVLLSLTQPYVIISGGPGTGKTRTTAKIIEALVTYNPNHRIALAAPTGKAAKKLESAIAENLSEAMKTYPQFTAQTVHRLVGKTPTSVTTKFNEKNLLPYDTIIIDESSMLDLEIANDIFSALSEKTQIILLGDKDQLEAVETGTLLAELSSDLLYHFNESFTKEYSTLFTQSNAPIDNDAICANHAIRFIRNYRQKDNSIITEIAQNLNEDNYDKLYELLKAPSDAFKFKDNIKNHNELNLINHYKNYIETLKENPKDKERVFNSFNEYRILCATNVGTFGVENINKILVNQLKKETLDLQKEAKGKFTINYPIGTPIMVTRNDYNMGLSNGEIGIVLLNEADEKRIVFLEHDKEFLIDELPTHSVAFAMTIHKSQGSDFKHVSLVISESQVLSKQLLYTGITRAKDTLNLFMTQDRSALSSIKDEKRHSGLIERLKEASS